MDRSSDGPRRRNSHVFHKVESTTRKPAPPPIQTNTDDISLPTIYSAKPIEEAPERVFEKAYYPGQPKSLEGIAIRSFIIGIVLATSVIIMLAILLFTSSPLWRIPFFFGALAATHFLEFWTTAKYNTSAAYIESFLLTANQPAYGIAHASACLECLLTCLLFPNRSWAPFYSRHILLLIGLIFVFLGQFVRSAAMAQAGPSFNHKIQRTRKSSHELVTTGLYSVLRHPSYFGYFYWAIGTQLVLGNTFCFFGYFFVLWRFFSNRIREEEAQLSVMFGEDYTNYKKKPGTGLPFIK
ncbi:Isoprenylcysteine carboxyl methyltransferase family-domain-containing protein [Xylariomycetidae sp. FL2044]|nr:Isoprenylcysteine carboxyl methyltransferase family-domain-containing protein [Xylariomycetidae sp. FL2044]